jgi:hypothetical protein
MVRGTFVPFTLNKGYSMILLAGFKPVQAKFALGRLVATQNALDTIPNDSIMAALARHVRGEWGELDPEDLASNEQALKTSGRLFSQYFSGDQKFWIITEADRSATTVLLPEDY